MIHVRLCYFKMNLWPIMPNQSGTKEDTPIATQRSHKHRYEAANTRSSHLAALQICGFIYYESWLNEQLVSFIANHHKYHSCSFSSSHHGKTEDAVFDSHT